MKRKKKDDSLPAIFSMAFVMIVAGSCICGLLECFGVRTGTIGCIFAFGDVLLIPAGIALMLGGKD